MQQFIVNKQSTRNESKLLVFFIYALFVYGWASINIILPILPQLMHVFHASHLEVNLTLSLFLVSFAISQIIWGPFSDKIGRSKILLIGLAMTVMGTLLAIFSVNMTMLIIARIIEAAGVGCAPVLARSIIMDKFNAEKITPIMANMVSIVAVLPVVASILGAKIDNWFGWRAIFIVLTLYGVALLFFAIRYFQESNLNPQRSLKLTTVATAYLDCFKNRQCLSSLLIYAMFYGSTTAYYTISPFLFLDYLHLDKQILSLMLAFTVVCYIAGAFITRGLVKKIPLSQIIIIAIIIALISAVLLIGFTTTTGLTVVAILLPMMVFIISAGMISPAVNTLAMAAFSQNRGAAAALLGFSMAGASGILSIIMASFVAAKLLSLTILISAIAIISLIVYLCLLPKKLV